MTSISAYIFFAAVLALVGLVSFRAVRWLVRKIRIRFPSRPKIPTLMRVGQVTAKPPEPPRSVVSLKEVKENDVVAPPSPPAVPEHRSATTMFTVEQLRDQKTTIDPKDIVDPADTPLADGSDYAFGKALTPFLAAALPDSAARKQELKIDLIRAGYYQPHAFENIPYLDALKETSDAKVGVQGYCMGGALSVRTAAAVPGRIGAVGSFHGGNGLVSADPASPHLLLAKTQARYLFATAKNDNESNPAVMPGLKDALDKAGRPGIVDLYQANHGWCVPDGAQYNQAEAERAWTALSALYKQALV